MSVKHQVARKELIDIGIEMQNHDFVVGTWGNMSIRIKDEDLIAITPSGIPYPKINADSIPILDMEGNTIDGQYKPSIELKMHLEIYKNRPDVNAIIQSHPTHCMALAMARKPIPAASEFLIQIIGGRVDCAPFEMPGTEALGKAVAGTLGMKNAVLVANHGLVVAAPTLKEAVKATYVCERTAQAVLLSYTVGGPVELCEDECEVLHDFYLNKYGQQTV